MTISLVLSSVILLAIVLHLCLELRSVRRTLKNHEAIMTALDNLRAEIAKNTSVVESTRVLLADLKARLDAAIASGDPAALQALSDQLGANDAALAAAVAENTPADGGTVVVSPPEPTPPTS